MKINNNNNSEKKPNNNLKNNNKRKKVHSTKDSKSLSKTQLKKIWKKKYYNKGKRYSQKYKYKFYWRKYKLTNSFAEEKPGDIKKRYFGLILKISLSLNNVFVTLVHRKTGEVVLSKHSGMIGFKGSKKKNPYVAGEVFNSLLADLDKLKIQARNTHVELHFHQKSSYAYTISKKLRECTKLLHVSGVNVVRSVEHSLGLRKPKERRV